VVVLVDFAGEPAHWAAERGERKYRRRTGEVFGASERARLWWRNCADELELSPPISPARLHSKL